MKEILGVRKNNFIIYAIAFNISILLSGLYFINKDCAWCILSCSVGASLVGAVLLAYFIDLSNNKLKNKQITQFRKEKFEIVKHNLIRILEILSRKVFILNKEIIDASKIYKLSINELITLFENMCLKQDRNMYTQDNYNIDLNYKIYFDGESCIESIISETRRIVENEDYFRNEDVFSQDEINQLRSISITFISKQDSFEIAFSNWKLVFECLFEIKEFLSFKSAYCIYNPKENSIVLYDKDNKIISRFHKGNYQLTEAEENGKKFINKLEEEYK